MRDETCVVSVYVYYTYMHAEYMAQSSIVNEN